MATAAERIAALENLVKELGDRVISLEDELSTEADIPTAGKPQRVLRPSVERIRRTDGRIVRRIVNPR